METVLVTGGAGFIGFHTAKALLERGDSVIVVDNFNDYYDPKIKEDRIEQIKDKIKLYKADVSDFSAMEIIFSENKITKVCHLAAQAGVRYSLENPFVYEKSNVLGTLNLLELVKNHDVKDFVFASSSSVYGGNKKVPFSVDDKIDKPISMYAATKKSCELMAYSYSHLFGLNCTGLRFFTVYGPWGRPDMALFIFAEAIKRGKPIKVFNFGKMKRDFTYVSDIVDGILKAIDKPFKYEIFNLGNSNTVELNYFIECIEKELGTKAEKKLMAMQPGDVPETFADIKKSEELLGFKPKVKIEEGIKLFLEWWKDYS